MASMKKLSVEQKEIEFSNLFGNEDGKIDETFLRNLVFKRTLTDLERCVCWKIFLGELSPTSSDSWKDQITKAREDYSKCFETATVNPSENHSSASFDDPLSTSNDSAWSKFFEDDELRDTIKLDLSRTHPETPFFQSETAQQQLLHVIFTWCKSHPDVSYRQGMNELAAPLLFVNSACAGPRDDENSLCSVILDEEFIEHDTYWIFEKIMQTMKKYFQIEKSRAQMSRGGILDESNAKPKLPIIEKCNSIQRSMLLDVDPALSRHLDKMKVEPQLFGLRWVRLMFSREFHLHDVLKIWDAIFASDRDGGLKFIDHMSCSMLLYIRQDLLSRGHTDILRRILHYPPVEDVGVLTQRARHVAESLANPRGKRELFATVKAEEEAPRTLTDDGLNHHRAISSPNSENDANGTSPQHSIRGSQFRRRPLQSTFSDTVGQTNTSTTARTNTSATTRTNAPVTSPSERAHGGGLLSVGDMMRWKRTDRSPSLDSKAATACRKEIEKLRSEVDSLKRERLLMADVLQTVIDGVQSELARADDNRPSFCEECTSKLDLPPSEGIWIEETTLLQSVAQVKQVRSVLGGLLDCVDVVEACRMINQNETEMQNGGPPSGSPTVVDPLSR
eukprot:787501_1